MKSLRDLVSNGAGSFRKYAVYKHFLDDYLHKPENILYILSVHKKGFVLAEWEGSRITRDNYRQYLSLRDYYKMHPFNGRYSYLVDDKLIIKYILAGTAVGRNIPAYYYLIDNEGLLHRFLDAEPSDCSADADSVINLLFEKQELVLKPVRGSMGGGFKKAAVRAGEIYVNGRLTGREAFSDLLKNSRNYIVSEYLRPHPRLAAYWPHSVNTIRYLAGRVGTEWRMIKSYIRFGTGRSGEIDNFNRGGILCYIDEEGHFDGGYILTGKPRRYSTEFVTRHPDTEKALTGTIPNWEELVELAEKIEQLIPQTQYLGFDFVVTDQKEVKLLEINTLNSLDALQLDCSILQTPNGKWFFGPRL